MVVKDGQVLLQKGYGYADVEKKQPVDPQKTLFRPGSVSKLFTWTAVMQQVERGKLDLDADVNQYLDFEIPPGPDGEPITHARPHDAHGRLRGSFKDLISEDPARIATLEDDAEALVPGRIFRPAPCPPTRTTATALAGYIVERVSGRLFDDYVEQNIFAPLGMRNPLSASRCRRR